MPMSSGGAEGGVWVMFWLAWWALLDVLLAGRGAFIWGWGCRWVRALGKRRVGLFPGLLGAFPAGVWVCLCSWPGFGLENAFDLAITHALRVGANGLVGTGFGEGVGILVKVSWLTVRASVEPTIWINNGVVELEDRDGCGCGCGCEWKGCG